MLPLHAGLKCILCCVGVGFLDSVKLQSAREGSGGTAATNIEQCTCPEGYVGQFCESCSPGYRRDPPSGGPYARCIPCNCNKHSDACDVATGKLFTTSIQILFPIIKFNISAIFMCENYY